MYNILQRFLGGNNGKHILAIKWTAWRSIISSLIVYGIICICIFSQACSTSL